MIAIEITNGGKDIKPLPEKHKYTGTYTGNTWGVVSQKDYDAAVELAANSDIRIGRRFWKPYTNGQGGSRGKVVGFLDFKDPAVRFSLGKDPKNVVFVQVEIEYQSSGGYQTKYSVDEFSAVEWKED